MALTSDIRDREFNKFRESSDDLTKVAVTIEGDVGILEGITYDDIQATYPTSTTEVYTYLLNTVQQAQIEVTYTNSSKNIFLRARRL